jgi:hypothetical protein
VLRSFAKFEREVIAVHTVRNFPASKRKGLLMGGGVPLGYDLNERQLRVIQPLRALTRTDLSKL